MGEAEVGTQFSVCRFKNLGIMDSIFRYNDCRWRVFSTENRCDNGVRTSSSLAQLISR